MTEEQIVIDLDLDIDACVQVDRNFFSSDILNKAVVEAQAHGRWREYGPVSTKQAGTVKAWKDGANPPVAWWGLEWAFLDGENHLIRTHDSAPLPEALEFMKNEIEIVYNIHVDMIQVNHYRDGEGLIWHSDLDSRGWTTNRVVTVSAGAPRDVVFSHFPENWHARLNNPVGKNPLDCDLPRERTYTMYEGDVMVVPMEAQKSILHAVLPGPGERYGFTFREHRMF